MAIVQMKCPNCGGTMGLVNNQFKCPNCRTMILNIVDAKIDADVTVMSPDEFARKIEESKRQFIVNINDNLKVFDVNTMVINKKIQDATQALEAGRFDTVKSILEGVPDDILSVERLRFLADFKVTNEYELSFYDGYIDTVSYEYGRSNHYSNIIKLADEQTKATYLKLAEYCRNQYNTRKQIETEILEVNKLLNVKLYQEAIAYSTEMCRKYPQTSLSWGHLCQVKNSISSNYNCNAEYVMMKECPDYSYYGTPKWLAEKIERVKKHSGEYHNAKRNFAFPFFGIGTLLAFAALTQIAYIFMGSGNSSNNSGVILLGVLIYLISLASAIAAIVMLVITLSKLTTMIKAKKDFDKIINAVPGEIQEEARKSNRFIDVVILASPIMMAIGVCCVIYFIKNIAFF